MNLTIVKTLSKGEQSLIMDTRPKQARGASEDALLDLHARVRRGRNKYSKIYRQGGSQPGEGRSRPWCGQQEEPGRCRAGRGVRGCPRPGERPPVQGRPQVRHQAAQEAPRRRQGPEGGQGQGPQGARPRPRRRSRPRRPRRPRARPPGKASKSAVKGGNKAKGKTPVSKTLGRLAALHQGPQEREAGPLMLVDGGIGSDLAKAASQARRQEELGFDGIWAAETNHDPFLALTLAAEHTEHASSSAPASRWRSPAAR